MEKRILRKIHDDKERVKGVGVLNEGMRPMLDVWDRIKKGEVFFTSAEGKKAIVHAVERGGVKYLTSNPDGVTANNLDELPYCFPR